MPICGFEKVANVVVHHSVTETRVKIHLRGRMLPARYNHTDSGTMHYMFIGVGTVGRLVEATTAWSKWFGVLRGEAGATAIGWVDA